MLEGRKPLLNGRVWSRDGNVNRAVSCAHCCHRHEGYRKFSLYFILGKAWIDICDFCNFGYSPITHYTANHSFCRGEANDSPASPCFHCTFQSRAKQIRLASPLHNRSFHIRRIFPVQRPFHRVVDNVFSCLGQFLFVADHPFVIIALPDRTTGVIAVLVDFSR